MVGTRPNERLPLQIRYLLGILRGTVGKQELTGAIVDIATGIRAPDRAAHFKHILSQIGTLIYIHLAILAIYCNDNGLKPGVIQWISTTTTR